MSEKAKNLRKYLSKTKVNKKNEDVPTIEETSELEDIIEKKEPETADTDPLEFFDQPKEVMKENITIFFKDLVSNAILEKTEVENPKVQEKEIVEKEIEDNDDSLDQKPSMIARVYSKKESIPINLISTINQKNDDELFMENPSVITGVDEKNEEGKPKLLGSLSRKTDEEVLLQKLQNENIEEQKKGEEDISVALLLPEIDENKKKRLMERMTSAKQGINKMTLGKALLKRVSDGILVQQFGNKSEYDSMNQLNQMLTKDLAPTYILNDSDVQIVKEGEEQSGDVKVKKVDLESIMRQTNTEQKKEKRSLNDILFKRKKKQEPTEPTETTEPIPENTNK